MPWKENNTVDLRLEFVMASIEKGVNFTQLCAEMEYLPSVDTDGKKGF